MCTPGQLTDDLCDQVRLYERLRLTCQREALDARSEETLRMIFQKRVKPSRGPFKVGDMVYFWSGPGEKDKERWRGPAEVALKDRAGTCHVKYAGKVFYAKSRLAKAEERAI